MEPKYVFIGPDGKEIYVELTHEDKAREIVSSRTDYKREFSLGGYKSYKDFLILHEHYIAIGPGYINFCGRLNMSQEVMIAKYRRGRTLQDIGERKIFHSDFGNNISYDKDDRSW